MPTLPAVIVTLLLPFERPFDSKIWRNAQRRVAGVTLAPGKRTISSALSNLGIDQSGRFAVFHQALNRARWQPLQLSQLLLLLVVGRLGTSTEPLVFGIDETAERHRGRKIAAKVKHQDPVRSTDDQETSPGAAMGQPDVADPNWVVRSPPASPFLTSLAPSDRLD